MNAQVRVKGFPDNFEGPIPERMAYSSSCIWRWPIFDPCKQAMERNQAIAGGATWHLGRCALDFARGRARVVESSVGELSSASPTAPGTHSQRSSRTRNRSGGRRNWRGATFPWVFLTRRHDRCVSHWMELGRDVAPCMSQVPDSTAPRRKGYWTEQILSSSLFRLYRLSAATRRRWERRALLTIARRSASHYSRLPHHAGNRNIWQLDEW